MVAPYTAVDLIRVMDHEMHHNHSQIARKRTWFGRTGDAAPNDQRRTAGRNGGGPNRRSGIGSLVSLLSKPAS